MTPGFFLSFIFQADVLGARQEPVRQLICPRTVRPGSIARKPNCARTLFASPLRNNYVREGASSASSISRGPFRTASAPSIPQPVHR